MVRGSPGEETGLLALPGLGQERQRGAQDHLPFLPFPLPTQLSRGVRATRSAQHSGQSHENPGSDVHPAPLRPADAGPGRATQPEAEP